jgi:ADP-ribosylglycohydrolase
MNEKARAMVLASFVADSLALGAHWIYDTAEIEEKIGIVDRLLDPPEGGFHPTKSSGDLTHYGDQALVLLESTAENKGFDENAFSRAWQDFFAGYKGYFDHATSETLEGFRAGRGPDKAGSKSTDLGGAARIAPLVYACRHDLEGMVASVRTQTAMTHRSEPVVRAAEFLARVTHRVLNGEAPPAAVNAARGEGFEKGDFGMWIEEGLNSAGRDTRSAVGGFGQHCGVMAALPSVIHLVVRYPDDLKAALVENVMAGGDSAARGMAAAMILGAHLGPGAVPGAWIAGLSARGRIVELLDRIDGA